ncbi:hypothetical protein FH608_034360 [Nonomuraea phyllanthi]|uniref:Uncharacterized protein n=1 Tax=Nonomuraea phyllanthi TaxID=2219224 RepID=A0A5C4VXJ6_9ACTN|nr:hypothetical protein [Nonomuraea phyllanthi]KAB8190603.1 hypothetical protein FH608_034360 [Nonomuraea phyllanthi]QFY05776.1 hypothetical protein GBF35_03010 [Nonomuraea phyllanthi]
MTTVSVSALTDEALVLKALKGISKTLSGSTAAATTIARKRAVFYNVLDYAVSPGKLLTANPLVGGEVEDAESQRGGLAETRDQPPAKQGPYWRPSRRPRLASPPSSASCTTQL